MTIEKEFLTVEELADLLSVSKRTIYQMVKRKDIQGYRIGNSFRFRRDDIEDFLSKCRTVGIGIKKVTNDDDE